MLGPLITLMLVAQTATAADASGERFQIVRVIRVERLEILRPICAHEARACTHFIVGNDVSAGCVQRDGAWSPIIRGHVTALVFAAHPKHAPHELKHIDDVWQTISAQIAAFESVRYESKEQCDAAHGSRPEEFRALFRTAAAASFAKRR